MVDGTTNLDVVDIDGAVDMASTALVTGVLTANGGAVFNEAGADVDFRVESDTVDHALFVQGSDGFVGIGTSSPAFKLEVESSSDADLIQIQSTASANNTVLRLGISGDIATLNASGGSTGALAFKTYGTERMRIDSAGNLGLGVTSSAWTTFTSALEVPGGALAGISANQVGVWQNCFYNSSSFKYKSTAGATLYQQAGSTHVWYNAPSGTAGDSISFTQAMTLDASGNVGIGTATPGSFDAEANNLVVGSGSGDEGITIFTGSSVGDYGSIFFGDATGTPKQGQIRYEQNNEVMSFYTNTSEKMRIDLSGNVGIGTTSISSPSGAAGPVLQMKGPNPELAFFDNSGGDNQASIYYLNNIMVWFSPTYGGTVLRLYTDSGNLNVIGSLSKGSGSFKIDHPLPAKTDTHHLVHSFIEGPQADLIYRGKVDLVAGSATANIDTVAGMTEGTFVALNREVQCFTTNESNWDAVKGSVSGNILTIESENSESTATISWLVIGERKDQHMYDTDWTDENGKVIVEPLKTNEE
jgi:hypothetical protein